MALNYDTTKCQGLTEEDWEVTKSIIFMTMAVDLGRITEANYETFAHRTRAWERVHGPSLVGIDENGKRIDQPLTTSDIRRRIGLRTNVADKTDAQWRTRIAKSLMDSTR